MKRLIVNADDFGYSFSVNKGIIEAHVKGIVTSTSVMIDAIASAEATNLVQFKDLSVGLHFVVKEGDDITAELKRQVEKFVSIVGHDPDHLDTHKMWPTDELVKQVLEDYATPKNIPVRRFGFAKFIDSYIGLRGDGDISVNALKKAIDQATEEYNELMCHVGYSDDYLRAHSSYNDMREAELTAITDPSIKQYIEQKGDLTLCNWRQLQSKS